MRSGGKFGWLMERNGFKQTANAEAFELHLSLIRPDFQPSSLIYNSNPSNSTPHKSSLLITVADTSPSSASVVCFRKPSQHTSPSISTSLHSPPHPSCHLHLPYLPAPSEQKTHSPQPTSPPPPPVYPYPQSHPSKRIHQTLTPRPRGTYSTRTRAPYNPQERFSSCRGC